MPKAKCSDISSLIGFVQEFGEKYFSTDGKILFCKVCEISVMAANGSTLDIWIKRSENRKTYGSKLDIWIKRAEDRRAYGSTLDFGLNMPKTARRTEIRFIIH